MENKKYPKKTIRKGFTKEEDKKLASIITLCIRNNGKIIWHKVYTQIPGKTLRQCKERWADYLNPNFEKDSSWSKEENRILEGLYNIYGPKWNNIATFLPNRSTNTVKNQFKNLLSSYPNIIKRTNLTTTNRTFNNEKNNDKEEIKLNSAINDMNQSFKGTNLDCGINKSNF